MKIKNQLKNKRHLQMKKKFKKIHKIRMVCVYICACVLVGEGKQQSVKRKMK